MGDEREREALCERGMSDEKERGMSDERERDIV